MDTLKHLKKDSTEYKDQLDAGLLDTFVNPRPGRVYEVNFSTGEVTSLCPVTRQPDFYRVNVTYIPGEHCIESKSLKLYLFSFRNAGMFAEDMANRILDDLCAICSPQWMKVECRMKPRGGIALAVISEYGRRPETGR